MKPIPARTNISIGTSKGIRVSFISIDAPFSTVRYNMMVMPER
jgi:hypothetical protein